MSKEYNKYAILAEAGALPANFDQWGLTDTDGYTVAHRAAQYGYLPDNFDQWDLASNLGRTVAHDAARWGHLPAHFSQWGLMDEDGRTVVHVAVIWKHLPVDFDQWSLTNNRGLTVLAQLLIGAQSDEYVARWEKEKPLCKTDADWEVFKKELPEIYQKYSISECMLDADNDHGTLLL
jgi:hypothetical protein